MLFDGPVASHEEVDTQDWILVAPFGDGLAAFGGDKTSAGCADCDVMVYGIGNQETNRASEGLIEGQGPEQQHDERDTRQSSRREQGKGKIYISKHHVLGSKILGNERRRYYGQVIPER